MIILTEILIEPESHVNDFLKNAQIVYASYKNNMPRELLGKKWVLP